MLGACLPKGAVSAIASASSTVIVASNRFFFRYMSSFLRCFARASAAPTPAAIVEGAPLANVYFAQTSFSRTVLSTVEAFEIACEWSSVVLHMCDAYGGPTRQVVVLMALVADKAYLKCVESLPKREFEELFGFRCGTYEDRRVISLDRAVLRVVDSR